MPLRSALPAFLAALLFDASTPLAKLLAGLLYLGSGFGLGALLVLRRLPGLGPGQQPHAQGV